MTQHTTYSYRRKRRMTVVILGVVVALALTICAVIAFSTLGLGSPAMAGGTSADRAAITTPAQPGELNADLLDRYERARAAAAKHDIQMEINSGARTKEEQQQMLQDGLDRYGSEEEAHRYVAPVEGSAHVQGLAIDVGPPEAAAWLAEHGEEFGLCLVYQNEPWHFEPNIAVGGTCPAMHADASWLWNH